MLQKIQPRVKLAALNTSFGEEKITCPSTAQFVLLKYSRLSLNFLNSNISVMNSSFFPLGSLVFWFYYFSDNIESWVVYTVNKYVNFTYNVYDGLPIFVVKILVNST